MPRVGLNYPLIVVLIHLLLSVPLQAQEGPAETTTADGRPVYRVPIAASVVRVDGILDEEAWEKALALELRYEVQPGENVPPPVRTEVLLAYDESRLYVAFRARDPNPRAIRARLRDRDSLSLDDWVGVVLDTFNDERRNYLFQANPLGVQQDQVETMDASDRRWDAIWDSAGRIHSWGYAVEMAIPFNSLRFQRSGGDQVWGFDAVRSYPRSQGYLIGLFPRDRSNNCYLCQAVKLIGFAGATPGRDVEIAPTVTAVRTDERTELPHGDFEARDREAEVGVTVRWGLTPNMTLSATANPDFSQVEADTLQLDVNQPFALSYPEKRPFFTEASDFFDTRLTAVYTRTMRDPAWGLKLTGKEGANTIGAYVVRDELTNLIFPGSRSSSSTSLDIDSTASVFRYRLDIWNNSTVGLLLTDREGSGYFNRVFGFDGDFRLTATDRLQMQFLGSSTRYPDAVASEFGQPFDDFDDTALEIFYYHSTRSWSWYLGYSDFGRGFRADLGFIPRVDYRRMLAGLRYMWNGRPDDWWWLFSFGGGFDHLEDHNGDVVSSEAMFWFYYRGSMQSGVDLIGSRYREAYNGVEFDMNYLSLQTWILPTADLYLKLEGIFDDRIDYANTRAGRRIRLNPYVSYAFGLHLRLSLNHTYERMSVDAGRLYTANISRASVRYQFSARAFLRSILQYVDYRYSSELYTFPISPEYRHLSTQVLFSYKLNARTVLFVGYSDNHFGSHQFGLAQADRTFFIKLGYAWVL